MRIARQSRIRPDLKSGPIRADSGKRERDGDIEVSRESPRSFARGAVEDLQRFGDAFNVDIVLDNVGGAGQTLDRLARHHAYRMDRPFRGGRHGIEADHGSRRYHDLTATLFRNLNEIVVLQERPRAQYDGRFSLADKRKHN